MLYVISMIFQSASSLDHCNYYIGAPKFKLYENQLLAN